MYEVGVLLGEVLTLDLVYSHDYKGPTVATFSLLRRYLPGPKEHLT